MEKKFHEKIFIDDEKFLIQSNIETLKKNNIDTSNLNMLIVHKFITKNLKIKSSINMETEEKIKILNLEKYNPLINYEYNLKDFIPFIKKGDEYLPIYGRDFIKNNKILIENKNNINIISLSFQNDAVDNLFTGASRLSIVKKILYQKLDEKYFNKLQFNNLFILNSDDMINYIQEILENLNLFEGDKSYNNYFIQENEFEKSIEHLAYKIKEKETIYLIIDEKGIVKHKGPFNESDDKMEIFLEKMLTNNNSEELLELPLEKNVKTNEVGKIKNLILTLSMAGLPQGSAKPETTISTKKVGKISPEYFEKFCKNFKNEVYSKLKINYNFLYAIKMIHYFPFNQKENIFEEPIVDYKIKIKVDEKDVLKMKGFLLDYFTIDEIKKFDFKCEKINSIKCYKNTGISCNICQKVLPEGKLKCYCYICDIHFCFDCANSKNNDNQLDNFDKLIHKEHYLIVYTNENRKDLLDNISNYKLGFNLYSFFSECDLNKTHNFGCDICGECNNGIERFICLSCDEGLMPSGGLTDICENCFKNVYFDDKEMDVSKKHKKDHVYLWMIYSGDDYYNY